MNSQEFKKLNFPSTPGVYFFRSGSKILYIGKATSLRDRVQSYFGADVIETRGPAILDMVTQATTVTYQETASVLEALILESNLIKKYLPKYNTKEKDNKSYNYVCITDEEMPRVLIERGKNIDFTAKTVRGVHMQSIYGPYPLGTSLSIALRIIRKIFPFFDGKSDKPYATEFYRQLELVPVAGRVDMYGATIRHIKLFLEGKKGSVIRELQKQMRQYAKAQQFERAGSIKRQLFALEHINDVALLRDSDTLTIADATFRIEAYDVAHLAGTNMVGVMTVVENGVATPSEYKQFTIKTLTTADDPKALEEILMRRLRHTEWGMPNLIVVDGNEVQYAVAIRVLARYQFAIPVVAVVKDATHKARALLGDEASAKKYKKAIVLANSEAHRFSLRLHREKRGKTFLKK